jgi:hypothetical protein
MSNLVFEGYCEYSLVIITTAIILNVQKLKTTYSHMMGVVEVAKPYFACDLWDEGSTLGSRSKVKLSLCLTNQALCHEDFWGNGCIDPNFLDLSTN